MAYRRLFGEGFLPVAPEHAPELLATLTTNSTFTSTQFNSGVTIPYSTEVFDTADAFNTTTYKFTCPSSGNYMVIAAMDINIASTLTVYKGTTAMAANDAAASVDNKLVAVIPCITGDTLVVKASGASATATYAKATTKNYLSIFKLA